MALDGVAELLRALRAAENGAATAKEAFLESAEEIRDEAKRLAPVSNDSRSRGKLRSSGRARATRTSGVVSFGTGRRYARPVVFGAFGRPQGGYTRPNPFIYEAADARSDEVVERFARYVEKVLAREGL